MFYSPTITLRPFISLARWAKGGGAALCLAAVTANAATNIIDAPAVMPVTSTAAAASDTPGPMPADPIDLAPPPSEEASSSPAREFWEAAVEGKVDVYARYRFEAVDDDQLPFVRHGYASTMRTAVGYTTQLFHDFGIYAQMEDVRVIGETRYADGGSHTVKRRATVVDPEGTELQQAFLRYRGIPRTQVMIGRQEIEHRAAPLNRFVGAIPWRQNWQSFNGIRVVSDYLPALKADYAFVTKVNRIFGQHNPTPDRSNYDLNGHFLTLTYSGIPYSTLEGYAYLMDFNSNVAGTRALSTSTYGARLQGAWDVVQYAAKLLYTAEYATQHDYANNPLSLAVDYKLLELGASKVFPYPEFESLMFKLSYEVLDGKGRKAIGKAFVPGAFQTPLGTNHAFQGWADRFLTTPADGIDDAFATIGTRAFATNATLVYHRFTSVNDSYHYGHEWNAQLTRLFADRYTVGIKYARYSASRDRLNLSRNGAASAGKQAFDLNKVWLWAEARF